MSAVVPVTDLKAPHKSFLKSIGHLGFECFTRVLPFVTKQAQAAEPFVDLLFPLQGGLFSTVVNSICMAEVTAAQASNSATAAATGVAKMEAVINVVGPQLLELSKQNGLVGDDAEAAVKRYVQAIFDLLDGPAKSMTATTLPAS